ncbi:MAG: ribosome biogenesis GTPase YlqF [Clostridiales bacterium]|jgi:ribosome biogenesis GTPase A|nr:ribosome biogenesis GTPase YlqF [Clostridiales bacterium]
MDGGINWFPGHMKKAVGIIGENLKLADAVIYVLDARAPAACINPEFEKILRDKPRLYALNKADLVDGGSVKAWLGYFRESGRACVPLNSATGTTGGVVKALKILLGEKLKRYSEKGVNKMLRMMVIGIPNSGKSTLINGLCGKKKTVTGDKPGVTKSKQWVRIADGFELLDTPGALSPRLDDQEAARDLCFIGSIKREIFDDAELALMLIERLVRIAPREFAARYGVSVSDAAPLDILREIAEKRGCVLRGGEVDTDRAAAAVLDDFRKTRIGRICLEQPGWKRAVQPPP